MFRSTVLLILVGLLAILASGGCTSQAQLLQQNQAMAIQETLGRGRFEMNCPEATAVVISQEVLQPEIQGPWVRGINRYEYTVGVEGCGQRRSYVAICPEGGTGCFAGPGRRE
jgi:hypothetical protein